MCTGSPESLGVWSLFHATISTSGWLCQRRSLMNNLRLVLTVAPNYASHSLSVWNDGYSAAAAEAAGAAAATSSPSS